MANIAKVKNAEEVPTIINSIRIGKTVYVPGSEDELAKVMSKDQVERLTASGHIFGFGSPAPVEEEEVEVEGDDETGSGKRGRKPKDAPPAE